MMDVSSIALFLRKVKGWERKAAEEKAREIVALGRDNNDLLPS